MGEVVPARTSPTLHPPSPPTVHQLSRLALLRVKFSWMFQPVGNTQETILPNGLVCGHAYSITDLKEVSFIKVVFVQRLLLYICGGAVLFQ